MAEITSHPRVNKCKRMYNFIVKINLFEDQESLSLLDQFLATRIFISLLIFSLIIIIGFTAFSVQTNTVTIHSPSEDKFKELSFEYPNTFSCLCKQSSIRQSEFISFNPQYHPICTSQFINQTFISSLTDNKMSDYWPLDYRTMAASHFQILAVFCRTIKQMVSDVLEEFSSEHITTNRVLSYTNFDTHTAALIHQLKATIVANNKHTSNFLLLNILQNEILSGLRTNYYRLQTSEDKTATMTAFYKFSNRECNCAKNLTCVHQAGIYNRTGRGNISSSTVFGSLSIDPSLLLNISGIMVGCLPYDSLLQSTLECFYNPLCIKPIQTYINEFSLVMPLLSTGFEQKMRVQDLLDQLFIESWNEKISFTNYYKVCSPHSCRYSYDRRFNLLYVIVTIVSLFGGLKTIMFFSALFIVKIIRRIQRTKYCRKTTDEIVTATEINTKQSLKDRLASFLRQVYRKIVTYNKFSSSSDINTGLYSTRLYLLLLSIGILTTAFYTYIPIRLQTNHIYEPSLNEYDHLYTQYPSTLECSCTHLSMPYSTIINITTRYHQVCSSYFVNDDTRLNYFQTGGTFNSFDFRIAGSTLFTNIKTLCRMSNETVVNELAVFNTMQFVNARVLTRNTFQNQTSVLIQQFQEQTSASFLGLFQLVRTSIQLNQFSLRTNHNARFYRILRDNQTSYYPIPKNSYDGGCSCGKNTSCTRPSGFYCRTTGCSSESAKPNQTIPGLVLSCSPIDSLLASSLQCFYNRSCIQMLIEWRLFDVLHSTKPLHFDNSIALDPTIKSRFSFDTKFEKIASELFVENWTNTTNYSSYYNQCAPDECTYTYEKRYNTAYIIATIFGIIGGLSVALEILIPPVVKLLRKMYNHCCRFQQQLQTETNEETGTTGHKYLDVIKKSLHFIRTMNLYRPVQRKQTCEESQSENQVLIMQRQKIATRFYIILFLFGIVVILLFTGINSHIRSITKSTPNESTFELLKSDYPSTLSCPCSQIAIPYSKFLSLKSPQYHQVCSSDFISSHFINLLWGSESTSKYISLLDVKILSTQFRLLSSLCSLAKNATEQKLKAFSSQQFVSVETLTQDSFQTQINSIIESFIVQTPANFRRTHAFILDILHANQLQNIFFTNWHLTTSDLKNNYIFSTNPMWYNESNGSCSCATSSICSKSLFINNNKTEKFPGLVSGCLPAYGLRLSTLECFYNETCLKRLSAFIDSSSIGYPLNISKDTRFIPVSSIPIGTLIDELFIERWENKSNYSAYFSSCAPLTCRYILDEKSTAMYILTTFLGLYGGLTVGLKFVVWHVLSIYWRIRKWFTDRYGRRIEPSNQNS